jgi:hypothetical protein
VAGAAVHATAVTLHPISNIPVVVNRNFTQSQGNTQDLNRGGYSFSLQVQEQDPGVGSQPRDVIAPPQSASYVRASGGVYHFILYASGAYVASVNSGGVDLLESPLVIDDNVSPAPIYVTLRDDYASLTGRIRPRPPVSNPQIPPLLSPPIPTSRSSSLPSPSTVPRSRRR